ncbi:MAG TPA: YggS family pyridoxal phosphate-dependent enzyme [Terriglobales bacterium]|nr:YggS family pyridoxal phosphate-dependent enzyme [Terriglobales bacterium]
MSLADQLERVRAAMAAACARRGRSESAVRLLAATKTVAPERIREAHRLGLRLFGENRVQEREAKREALADLEAEWHLLGPLQGNKAARALAGFDLIETLDSLALAQRLSRLAPRPAAVMLEINIGEEPQKHGVAPAAAEEVARAVAALPGLALGGVMGIPPAAAAAEASRRHFAALAELGERVRQAAGAASAGWELSMGMSHDFEVAIEEGATLVRLGQALFGSRR